MEIEGRKLRITFTERLLGTCPPREAYEKYILSKAPVPDDEETREELETVVGGDRNEGICTRFHRDDDGIYLLDYQVKGFLKEAANVLKENLPNARPGMKKKYPKVKTEAKTVDGVTEAAQGDNIGYTVSVSKGIQAAKSKIDNFVFVFPRFIFLQEKADGRFARPLRAQTAQGPRVSMVESEYVEAGASIDISIDILPGCEIGWDAVEMMLNYGAYKGIGQFRNGSFGRFKWEWLNGSAKVAAA